jgi:hypothetical protein
MRPTGHLALVGCCDQVGAVDLVVTYFRAGRGGGSISQTRSAEFLAR